MKIFNFAFLLEDTCHKKYDALEEAFMSSKSQPLFGQTNGTYFADYTIKAKSMKNAILEAKDEIKDFGVTIVRVTPEPYVTASDIAKRVFVSKEAIRQMILGHTKNKSRFPHYAMLLGENKPVWAWAIVAEWMFKTGRIKDKAIVTQAKDLYLINKQLEPIL